MSWFRLQQLAQERVSQEQRREKMSSSWRLLALLALLVGVVVASAAAEDGEEMERVSRAVRYILTKRKPSIGLSLAEYMAEGGKGDNFHFLPSRRSGSD